MAAIRIIFHNEYCLPYCLLYFLDLLILHLQLVLNGLAAFLGEALGDALDQEGKEAWGRLINNVIVGVEQELEVLQADIQNE